MSKSKQATPEPEREFTLTEIRAANVARDQIINNLHDAMTPQQRLGIAGDILARLPEALSVDEPTDALIVERLFVNGFLALDLAAKAAGVNLNEAIPMIFNEESQRLKVDIEFDYVPEK